MEETFTTPADVRARWVSAEPLPDDDIIQAWITDAETLIYAEVPSIVANLTDDPLGQWRKKMVFVTVQVVSQALKNPEGIRQTQQTSGVFSNSVTYGAETIDGVLRLTPAQKAILTGHGKRHVGLDMTVQAPTLSPLDGVVINGPTREAP